VLTHAYLARRPVMVLDEWAADQDPTFRCIFYTEILADLKRHAKSLIVISHDDRYFSAADHSIRLEDGRIVEEVRPLRVPVNPQLVAGRS
jgi:putative ATP-binding cassette transporter